MGEELDLGVDTEDAFESAICGGPVAEQVRRAPECLAGIRKSMPREQAARLTQVACVDRKLINSRLSHIVEGSYDINGDVVRSKVVAPPWPQASTSVAGYGGEENDAMDVEDVLDEPVFRKRNAPPAQANR